MGKKTLLELTQAVLSSMDSDEITSISDSVESVQAALVVKTAYEDIITRLELPEHFGLFTLTESGDTSKPTLMTLPSTVNELLWLKYNVETTTATDMAYADIKFLALKDFLDMMYAQAESDTVVIPFTHLANGFTTNFLYTNDRAPTYYTTFDDNTVVFDSYDVAVDTSYLVGSKSLGYGSLVIEWVTSDTFTPDLDANLFPLLLNEAKALAWAELKQTPHQKAEINAKRGWTVAQKTKDAIDQRSFFERTQGYGRK